LPKLSDQIASALQQTVEGVQRGAGKTEVRLASYTYFKDIERVLGRSFTESPRCASRVYVLDEDEGGDALVATKKRDGLLAVTDSSFILVRELSIFRNMTSAFPSASFKAEPIELTVKRERPPGLRLRSASESIVVGLHAVGIEPERFVPVRDRFVALVNSASG
jgi:hypothetical protein